MIRLGFQGVEYMQTGRFTVPMPVPARLRKGLPRADEVPLLRAAAQPRPQDEHLDGLLAVGWRPSRAYRLVRALAAILLLPGTRDDLQHRLPRGDHGTDRDVQSLAEEHPGERCREGCVVSEFVMEPKSLCDHVPQREGEGLRDSISLTDLVANVPPGWHDESWTWEDEERDIAGRPCLCCGRSGHHQEQVEALVIAAGGVIEPVCIGEDGRLHDGHHRVVAAMHLGIERIPLETRAEADARWNRDHGTHIPELRRFGDIPYGDQGEHWDWIQKIRQEARDFVAWEAGRR